MQSADFVSYKVLTLRQPYAYLLASGHKRLETRGWQTDYRGLLLIHAGVSLASMALCREPFFREALAQQPLALGAIIGCVNLVEIHPVEDLAPTEKERAFGDYAPGRFGWLTEEAKLFSTPFPMKGKLSLWTCARDELLGGAVRYANMEAVHAHP